MAVRGLRLHVQPVAVCFTSSRPLLPLLPIPIPVSQAYVDLLRQVGLAARRSDGAAPGLLGADIPAVIRAVAKQLRSKSAKTKARGGWGDAGVVLERSHALRSGATKTNRLLSCIV